MPKEILEKDESINFFESRWWENLNPKYLQCQQDCKQSAIVEVLVCPQFKKTKAGGKS